MGRYTRWGAQRSAKVQRCLNRLLDVLKSEGLSFANNGFILVDEDEQLNRYLADAGDDTRDEPDGDDDDDYHEPISAEDDE